MCDATIDSIVSAVNAGLTIRQEKDSLLFGTDALLLAAFVRRQKKARMIEFGAGCGIVSLLLAAWEKCASVEACEINPASFACLEQNAASNRLSDRVRPRLCDIRTLAPDDCGGPFDAAVMNPPYMKTDTGYRNEGDGKFAARHEVFGGIGDFCVAANRLLRHGGVLYTVYRPDRLTDLCLALRENGLEPKRMIFVYNDPLHDASMVLVEAKKGGRPDVFVTRPFFLKEAGEHSADVRYMMENGDFNDCYVRR